MGNSPAPEERTAKPRLHYPCVRDVSEVISLFRLHSAALYKLLRCEVTTAGCRMITNGESAGKHKETTVVCFRKIFRCSAD
jgi:hypothetical protein